MKVLTVIVNYRTAKHVLTALDALVPQLRARGGDAKAVVVDNLSPDDSVKVLREGLKARGYEDCVRLIESKRNGGFGAGNNVAIREALHSKSPPEYVYLLNPDATPDPGALDALVSFMDAHRKVGIAGSFVHDPDGTPHCSSFRFPSLLSEVEGGLRLGVVSSLLRDHTVYMPVPDQSCPVDWVSGASMMLRTSVLERVGLFDETFFRYFEEVDLCRRVREAGHEIWFVREASVGHVGSVATGLGEARRTPAYWFESRAHYLRKAHGTRYLTVSNAVFAGCFALHRVRQVVGRKNFEAPHFLRDFVRYNFLPQKESR